MNSSRLAIVLVALAIAGCAGGVGGNDGGIAPAGNVAPGFLMTVSRADQTATVLSDGKVLLTGGTENDQVGSMLASAELYDPARAAFAPTGSMSAKREGHTATLLGDGRVLIAGGMNNFGYRTVEKSADIYDPASGTFTPVGNMTDAREGHTATLLPDGRVLLTGGRDNGTVSLDSAELYYPGSRTFAKTSRMAHGREAHTATLLRDGKVLIVGGGESGLPGGYITLSSSELYDPVSGTFSPGGKLLQERFGHSATLLRDGRVLVVGGHSGRVTGLGVFAAYGFLSALSSAELYDPEMHSFSITGAMVRPHYLHTATILSNGRVLVAGGWNIKGPAPVGIGDAEIYDPASGRFGETDRLNVPRLDQTANLLSDGRVLVAGGMDSQGRVTASCELYDPASGMFIDRPPGTGGLAIKP
jgi:hypothetical protein